jgi:hypothetical protein
VRAEVEPRDLVTRSRAKLAALDGGGGGDAKGSGGNGGALGLDAGRLAVWPLLVVVRCAAARS